MYQLFFWFREFDNIHLVCDCGCRQVWFPLSVDSLGESEHCHEILQNMS